MQASKTDQADPGADGEQDIQQENRVADLTGKIACGYLYGYKAIIFKKCEDEQGDDYAGTAAHYTGQLALKEGIACKSSNKAAASLLLENPLQGFTFAAFFIFIIQNNP